MSSTRESPITILIPHFQTLDSIKLCLRSIRKFTRPPYVVRVLDNGSQDASLDYLRSLRWIDLVAADSANDIWKAHYLSLNKAVSQLTTPYFLLMHSDTYVHRPGWLDFLQRFVRAGCVAAGPRHQRVPVRTLPWLLPAAVQHLRTRERRPGVPELRSFCALYETAPFHALGCTFFTEKGEDITCRANEALVRAGHPIRGLSAFELSPYVFHASAGTLMAQGVQPLPRDQIKNACQRGVSYLDHRIYHRSSRFLDRFLNLASTRAILADETLDA